MDRLIYANGTFYRLVQNAVIKCMVIKFMKFNDFIEHSKGIQKVVIK